jgi:hypothetical protein
LGEPDTCFQRSRDSGANPTAVTTPNSIARFLNKI